MNTLIWLKSESKIVGQTNIESDKPQTVLKANGLRSAWKWLWQRPLLLILLAHTIFSMGIWNARDGYWEETSNVIVAFQVLHSHHPSSSIYIDLIALALHYFTSDPLVALTFVKYLSSLLATMALYLGLSCFSAKLRQSAIVFACLVWIASSLDAPFSQSASLSLFTFAIMLFGIDCLLISESIKGLLGFYFLGTLAALLRPEYFLPLVLLTLILAGWAVWSASKFLEMRFGWLRNWTCGMILCLALAAGFVLGTNPPKPVLQELNAIDQYALTGLGQCYADFYHREHPELVFEPMTEYQDLLDQKFDKPTGFGAALKNNPWEALRYFTFNATRNLLKGAPGALLNRYREQRHRNNILDWMVRGILIYGAYLGVRRLRRFSWRRDDFRIRSIIAAARQSSTMRKLFLLLLLLSTSSVAVILLIGTPRYFLGWTPLFYLGVAFGADSLLRASNRLLRHESILVALAFICLCAPNFLAPRPNQTFDAVRHIAPLVKEHPVIATSWADPFAVLALCGKARAVSFRDGIRQTDIENGKIDILLIDESFRRSKTWADQREFFNNFECHPETWGFKKEDGIPTGQFKIYYKPNSFPSGAR